MNDQLQKFMFNAAPVRGEIVSLSNTWQEVLTRRSYPAPVRTMLGTDTFNYDDRGLMLSAAGPSGASSFSYTGDSLMASRTDASLRATVSPIPRW